MTRRDEILKLIVEHFIKTAEPVGSKTLQEVYHLDVSSATIRNEMNALEQDGYLEKTHTSSGRVPSEKGYQYYAEHIRETGVDEQAKNALANVLSEKSKSVEEVMKEACEILSHMAAFQQGASTGGAGNPFNGGGFSSEGFGDVDLGDIFQSFFGGGGSSRRQRNDGSPRKGDDTLFRVKIDFMSITRKWVRWLWPIMLELT